jgi:hypothetical protein
MNERIKLGSVLCNNDHTLVLKIRKNKFSFTASIGQEDLPIVRETSKGWQQNVFGFYNYKYRNPADLAKNFTPDNMIFYALLCDNSFTPQLEQFGYTWLGNIDFKPEMAPLTLYAGGIYADNVSMCASEFGELISPCDQLKHFTSNRISDLAEYGLNKIDFLKNMKAVSFEKIDLTNSGGRRYNPKNN